MRNYGLPYMGSKSKIAGRIFRLFPTAENFYDLFCGGCAMTHYALLHKNYKNIFANDIDVLAPTLFDQAIHGKFRNEKRWISREDFFALKDKDPYVKFCWSFGNDGRTYLYGREIEMYKKACHFVIVFDKWADFEKLCPEVSENCKKALDKKTDIVQRRLSFGSAVVAQLKRLGDWQLVENNPLYRACKFKGGKNEQTFKLQSLERLQSLESLQSLERLKSLHFSFGDYSDVKIKKNSVIYCDIPYEGTAEYDSGAFDYERFYAWCEKQTEPLFVSSYSLPEDRFVCVDKITNFCTRAANVSNKVVEKVFIPKSQAESYRVPGELFNFDEF